MSNVPSRHSIIFTAHAHSYAHEREHKAPVRWVSYKASACHSIRFLLAWEMLHCVPHCTRAQRMRAFVIRKYFNYCIYPGVQYIYTKYVAILYAAHTLVVVTGGVENSLWGACTNCAVHCETLMNFNASCFRLERLECAQNASIVYALNNSIDGAYAHMLSWRWWQFR